MTLEHIYLHLYNTRDDNKEMLDTLIKSKNAEYLYMYLRNIKHNELMYKELLKTGDQTYIRRLKLFRGRKYDKYTKKRE